MDYEPTILYYIRAQPEHSIEYKDQDANVLWNIRVRTLIGYE